MLQTFLTGLREGLEAALVVGILISFLVRGDHRDRLAALWTGVAVAIVLAFGFGAVLHFTSSNMSFEAQEAFGGILSIVAVGFVTWMVFWMRKAARTIKHDLHGKMQAAVDLGPFAVGVAAFLAVGREGLETALFIYPTFEAQGAGVGPAAGAVLGIATAVGLGWLLYRGAVQLDMEKFFRITGIALIVIAAGVLAYGIHDLQEAAILPGIDTLAWDLGLSTSSWYGTLLKGIFNFGPQMTVLEVLAYVAYVVPTVVLFLLPKGTGTPRNPEVGGNDAEAPTPASLPIPRSPAMSAHEPTRPTTDGAASVALRRFGLGFLALTALWSVTGCADGSGGTEVAVTGTDSLCELAETDLAAGKLTFRFTNEAADVNELYVLRKNGEVVAEVEGVTTGTSRTLNVDLAAGDYKVRCKPGQTGEGFTSTFEVTGKGGAKVEAADRTITFDVVDFTYEQLDLGGISVDDTIRFVMTNGGEQPHEFEVLDPDGVAVGEIGAVEPGETGTATITFERGGKFTYQCILKDPATGSEHTMLGMKGDFAVGA